MIQRIWIVAALALAIGCASINEAAQPTERGRGFDEIRSHSRHGPLAVEVALPLSPATGTEWESVPAEDGFFRGYDATFNPASFLSDPDRMVQKKQLVLRSRGQETHFYRASAAGGDALRGAINAVVRLHGVKGVTLHWFPREHVLGFTASTDTAKWLARAMEPPPKAEDF